MNQQKPRTSIIMPVYNTAASVVRAIKSVQAQTDPDWELVVVIDASPDHAKDVIEQHLEANPDPRVRVFAFDENRGVSAARNTGLEQARGEWLAFLDSDDAYEPRFLEALHTAAHQSSSEIAVCAHKLISTDGAERVRERAAQGEMDGRDAVIALLHDSFTPYLWDKIFLRDTVRDARFAEEIHRAEDALFVLNALMEAHKIVVTSEALYRYTVDAGGLTWGRVTPVRESDALVALMAEATKARPEDSTVHSALTVSKVLTYLNNAQQALVVDSQASKEALSQIRNRISLRDALTCFKVRPIFGAAGLLLKVSPSLYRSLYGFYIKRRYGMAFRSSDLPS